MTAKEGRPNKVTCPSCDGLGVDDVEQVAPGRQRGSRCGTCKGEGKLPPHMVFIIGGRTDRPYTRAMAVDYLADLLDATLREEGIDTIERADGKTFRVISLVRLLLKAGQ